MIKTKGSAYFTNLSEMQVEIFNEAHPNVELSTIEELQAFIKKHYGVLASIEINYFPRTNYAVDINGITPEGVHLLDDIYENFAEIPIHYLDDVYEDGLLADYLIDFIKYLSNNNKIKPV
jgi:hypothetical protein